MKKNDTPTVKQLPDGVMHSCKTLGLLFLTRQDLEENEQTSSELSDLLLDEFEFPLLYRKTQIHFIKYICMIHMKTTFTPTLIFIQSHTGCILRAVQRIWAQNCASIPICIIPPITVSRALLFKDRSAGWSIQLVEADQGSNANIAGFCNAVEKIRNAYRAFDLKTNTGKIWSITTRFPGHILGGTKFRISIWTDFSPHPLLLTQDAGCITHDLIVEILRATNQYPAREEWLLGVCGSDEFLQNNCALGSHEILRKATPCIQLRLHHARGLRQSLARTCGDDQRRFGVNELLEDSCAWRLIWQNLVSVILNYRGQVEYLLQNENNVDNVIEAAKAICSVLCCVETREITDAVRKLHALVEAQVKDAFSCPIFLFKTRA
ncbi:Phosphatidylinositol 4-phosphate 3-kinase C2 domain-containing subunit gamma [Lamprotornis superbus]|uniref:Phosphatidylinositol 4-phosphate 3-kinase C2 domain-containing subunit gamma n=1 Tax=Lamprotornis superbus TaxID=245042 RepID=A0A835NWL3_9PASS|nr:Phosphatidylinositol 4-phosphate 3-kinase C2 domain-containing subunit gamma [Lamprotornis superbus]